MMRILLLFSFGLLSVACIPRQGPGELLTDDRRIDFGPGSDESGSAARRPKVCASGGFVYVVWVDDRAIDARVRMNRSLDGGFTWLPGDVLVSTDTPQGFQARNPSVACEQGRVVVAWEDDRDGPLENPGIYVNVSQDAGANWLPQSYRITIDEEGDWRSLEPQISLFGTDIYVVWYDGRAGAFDIYFNRGAGFGQNWLIEEIRLDTDDDGAAYSARPRMASTATGEVFVTWVDSRDNTNDIYFNRSLDHGIPGTWLATDIRLDDDVCFEGDGGCEPSDSFAPEIVVRDGVVAVAWHERSIVTEPDGSYDKAADIYINVATEQDPPDFSPDPTRVDTDGPQVNSSQFPQVGILDSGRVALVWRDDRAGGFDILYSHSDDWGESWLASETRLDSNPAGASHSTDASMSVGDDGNLAVVWSDLRSSTDAAPWEDLYITSSSDAGECWFEDRRVDDDPPGSARSVFPWVGFYRDPTTELEQMRIVWEEWRFGNADIYYRGMPFEGEVPVCANDDSGAK